MEVIFIGALSGAIVGLLFTFFGYVIFDFGLSFSAWWEYRSDGVLKTLIIAAILGAIISYLGHGSSSVPMCRGGLGWSNCP